MEDICKFKLADKSSFLIPADQPMRMGHFVMQFQIISACKSNTGWDGLDMSNEDL